MYTVSPVSANPQLRSQGHVDAGVANRSRHLFGSNVSYCDCADWFCANLFGTTLSRCYLVFRREGTRERPGVRDSCSWGL